MKKLILLKAHNLHCFFLVNIALKMSVNNKKKQQQTNQLKPIQCKTIKTKF